MGDPIDILSQLFGTLKDASNRNEAATQRLIDQQMELVGHIKSMPIEDIRKALTDHVTESRGLMSEVLSRVTKMLIVVSVAITVATAGYFMIKYAAEQHTKKAWEDKYIEIEKAQEDVIDKKLELMMDEIRKEMQSLHNDDEEIPAP